MPFTGIGKKPQRPYPGKMISRLSPELCRKAALAADLPGKNLNQWAKAALPRVSG